jgi:hypothetical protein
MLKTKHQRHLDHFHPARELDNPDKAFDALLGFLELLDTPRALTVYILAKNREWKQIFDLEMPKSIQGINSHTFSRDYAATKWLSKISGVDTGIDCMKPAVDTFTESELRCANTNRLFDKLCLIPNLSVYRDSIARLEQMREKIRQILGPLPDFEFILKHCTGWTPGATSSVKGRLVSKPRKYAGKLHTTKAGTRRALQALAYFDLWSAAALEADGPACVLPSGLEHVRGNKLVFVPKNAKTFRGICIEAHVLTLLQRAYGTYIVRRLALAGVDLSHGQSVNKSLAQFGSLTGDVSTTDVRAASDSLALGPVCTLLPEEWVEALVELRSPFTQLPTGRWVRLEKFSSMGNGFTFELESLIFTAAVLISKPKVWAVYGDDLITDTQCTPQLHDDLRLLGFEVNTSKTFADGYFRESCGGDFHRGNDVTPPYLRNFPRTLGDWVHAHNQLRSYWSKGGFLEREHANFLSTLRRKQPAHLGSAGYGDSHYHVNLDEARPYLKRKGANRAGWQGYVFKTYTSQTFPDQGMDSKPWALLATSLGPKGPDSVYESTVQRGRTWWKKGTIVAFEWHDVWII